jgi:hypothetical protein
MTKNVNTGICCDVETEVYITVAFKPIPCQFEREFLGYVNRSLGADARDQQVFIGHRTGDGGSVEGICLEFRGLSSAAQLADKWTDKVWDCVNAWVDSKGGYDVLVRADLLSLIQGLGGMLQAGEFKKSKAEGVLHRYCAALKESGMECSVDTVAPVVVKYFTRRQLAIRMGQWASAAKEAA